MVRDNERIFEKTNKTKRQMTISIKFLLLIINNDSCQNIEFYFQEKEREIEKEKERERESPDKFPLVLRNISLSNLVYQIGLLIIEIYT